ncbi:MAG: hypothetical protein DMF84_03220 [Acidobacteria bacterium]|nr:MAG: hypothetical protein DMF84_03220 [Acidobacteriota bacterium]
MRTGGGVTRITTVISRRGAEAQRIRETSAGPRFARGRSPANTETNAPVFTGARFCRSRTISVMPAAGRHRRTSSRAPRVFA